MASCQPLQPVHHRATLPLFLQVRLAKMSMACDLALQGGQPSGEHWLVLLFMSLAMLEAGLTS